MAKRSRADAMIDSRPGGPDWEKASPSARIVSAALESLAAALDDMGELAKAVDHGLDNSVEAREIANALDGIGRSIVTAIEQVNRTS